MESVFSAVKAREPFSRGGGEGATPGYRLHDAGASWMLLNNERIRRCLASGLSMQSILLAKVTINDDGFSRPSVLLRSLAVKYWVLSRRHLLSSVSCCSTKPIPHAPTLSAPSDALRCCYCRVPLPSHCAIHIRPSFDNSIATDIAF